MNEAMQPGKVCIKFPNEVKVGSTLHFADSLLRGVAGYEVGVSFALVPHGGCLPCAYSLALCL